MKFKFTDTRIAKLPPPTPPRKDYWCTDTQTPHLALRVTAKSKLPYFKKRPYLEPLGKFPAVATAAMTKEVKVRAGKVAAGVDLRAEKVAKKAKQDQVRADAGYTLEDLISDWERAIQRTRRPRYVRGAASVLRRAYAKLLDRPAESIAKEQIRASCEALADLPAARRAAGEKMQTLYNWGVRNGKVRGNPTKQMVLAEKTKPRKNFLTGDEMRQVWRATEILATPCRGPLLKLLVSSGVRLREAAEARWREFSPDLAEWTIPGERMKEGESHVVWLPLSIRALLAGLPRFASSDLVFTADGKRAVTGFTHLKKQLDKALAGAAVKPFTFHDFRRSMTTWLARNGVDSIVADRLLAHTQLTKISAVASTYNLFDFEPQRRAALERWVAFLEGESEADTTTPQLMLPAPEPVASAPPPIDPPAVFRLTGLEEQEAKAEENFSSLLLRIGSRSAVIRINYKILKRDAFAPKFLETLAPSSDPREVAISVLTHTAALAHQGGITVYKRSEIAAETARRIKEEHRWRDKAKKADAAFEQARGMGYEEYASRANAEAQKATAIANLWDGALQTMMAPDDVCAVVNRKGDPGTRAARARGVFRMLLLQTEIIFGKPESGIAAVYTTAVTGIKTLRWKGRHVISSGEVEALKRAASSNVLDRRKINDIKWS